MSPANIGKWILLTTAVYAVVYRVEWTRTNVLNRTA